MEEEQIWRQKESQEVAKSRSPGSGKFQWQEGVVNRIKCHRVTSSVRSGKFAMGWVAIPETFDRSTGGNQCS